MKSGYLISCDIDGTLLNKKRKIPLKNRRFIKKAIRNGNLFVLNTGRPYQGIIDFVKKLRLYNTPISVTNGAAIIYLDKNYKIVKSTIFAMDKNRVMELIKDTEPFLALSFASSLNKYFSSDFSQVPFFFLHIRCGVKLTEGDMKEIIDEDLLNVSLQTKNEFVPQVIEIIKTKYPEFEYTKWDPWKDVTGIQVALKTANKGHALKYLQEQYKIQSDKTIAFGDELNDISMLKAAKEGYVMKNAKERMLKDAIRVTAKDNSHSGVSYELKRILK